MVGLARQSATRMERTGAVSAERTNFSTLRVCTCYQIRISTAQMGADMFRARRHRDIQGRAGTPRISRSYHYEHPTTLTMQSQPTNATQAKDRNYMQLGHSLARMSRAIAQTADLCELMKVNLDAMRVLSASHAAQ